MELESFHTAALIHQENVMKGILLLREHLRWFQAEVPIGPIPCESGPTKLSSWGPGQDECQILSDIMIDSGRTCAQACHGASTELI